jgi:integrase
MGGLHPNEVMTLRWVDIGIGEKKNRMQVFNAKLKRYKQLYKREVPLFPEVLEELDKLRLTPGNENREFVINHYSNRESVNLVQPFNTIAIRAGIGKVVRPFDNMRASRSTEVERKYGAKAESVWLGHSPKVAKECYLMITDDDYDAASGQMAVQSTDKADVVPFPGVTLGDKSAS